MTAIPGAAPPDGGDRMPGMPRVVDAVEVDGMRIAYERAGQGPPLVLVHGFVGDGHSTWASQLEALSDEFTVVAWDTPGAGRSADPPEWFRLPDFADCLAAFVAALGLRRPHIAGLSFGGAMILELYRRHSSVARTLILAGAYAGWAGSLPPAAVAERVRFCLDAAALPPQQFGAAMLPSMFAPAVNPERVASFAAAVRDVHPGGFRTMSLALAEADLRSMLGEISVPTLVLSGDCDMRAPLDTARALHAAIPGSRLVVLEGVGHVSAVEAAERFNTEVRAFSARSRQLKARPLHPADRSPSGPPPRQRTRTTPVPEAGRRRP